ncbi:MAG: hypothetical protein RBT64_01545, partial [Trichloromonas sp.]|nr:hypothetical protein [Trichloromonas sp.]
MSRIEKAIEMAAKKRQSTVPVPPESPAEPSAAAPMVEQDAAREQGHYEERHEVFASVPPPLIRNPFLVTASGETGPASEQYRKLK